MNGTRDEWMNYINTEQLVDFLKEFTEVVNIGGFIVNLNGEKISEDFNADFLYAATYISQEFYQPQKVIALINQSVKKGFTSFKGLTVLPFPITINDALQGFILLIDKTDFDYNSTIYGHYHLSHSSFTVEDANKHYQLTEKSEEKASKLSNLFFKMSKYIVRDLLNVNMEVHQVQVLSSYEKDSPGKTEIIKATEYIKKNLDKQLSLKEVADQVYFSHGYFSKLFKKELGMNFVEYLNLQRINEASHLLATSDLKIDQISKKVGFSQASYFCKIFKEITQVSPVAYRKQSKKIAAVS